MSQRVNAERLLGFCRQAFIAAGLNPEDAGIAADALVTTDLRGVDSHGVAHLPRYLTGLLNGSLNRRPNIRVLSETASTALVDGDRGLGFVVSYRAMQIAIQKAKTAGSGWVVVRGGTHYGAAGYWASLALEHHLIGFSLCTSASRIAPTFGAAGMVGTNPIAIAVPAGVEPPFLLDMATCVVPMGRLEIHAREKKPLPEGWVIDAQGRPITDPELAFKLTHSAEAMLLPLGGVGEVHSGYKGYGLGVAVEIMCNLLGGYAGAVVQEPGRESECGQFFGALSVEAFRPLGEFQTALDARLREYKATPALPGAERVLVAGQKEAESSAERLRDGIPLSEKVIEQLREAGLKLGVAFPA